jgi:predicted O-methyltransferase YrrM
MRAYRGVKIGRLATRNGALQKLSEVAPFLASIGHPRTVVEIGAGKGGMLAALCAVSAEDATIISVDLEGGPFGRGASDPELRSRANAKPRQKLHLVRDHEICQRVATLTSNGIDVLLIDGDHTYEGVSSDFRLYSPLVAPCGIIALHDILPHPGVPECQVDRFWGELTAPRKREIVSPGELNDHGAWGGIGIVASQSTWRGSDLESGTA